MDGQYYAEDEPAMLGFGKKLYAAMEAEGVVFLQGDLGLGKTTLSRGVIRAAGHLGVVKGHLYVGGTL